MNNETVIQIIATATVLSSSIGLILVLFGKIAHQTLLYLIPAFLISLIMFVSLNWHKWRKKKI